MALAAEEATFDDPAFDPAMVQAAAAELHAGVVAAWSADNRKRLAELVSPELLAEWVRRLDELRRRGWCNPLRRRGRLQVRYVGLANRTGQRDDRVVVHLRARMDDAIYDRHGRIVFRDLDDSGRHTHCEFWTLGRRDGRWGAPVGGDRTGGRPPPVGPDHPVRWAAAPVRHCCLECLLRGPDRR